MNYQLTKLALALFFGAGFLFILNHSAQAAPDHIVINEVQITGGTGQTYNEFIELFNPTSTPFDLQGYQLVKRASSTNDTPIKSWTSSDERHIIPAYGFYLWAHTRYANLGVNPDTSTGGNTHSGFLAEDNGVALRQTTTGTIIDSLAWGTATNAFVEGTAYAENPTANQSLERKRPETGSRQDLNDNSQDFSLQLTPSPQNTQSAIENVAVNTPAPSPIIIYLTPPPAPTTPQPGEVVINELVSDPADGSEEWIELYNKTSRVIDLVTWTIEDGSGATTNLSGSLGTDSASRYLVTKSPRGNLNNGGDLIKLKYQEVVIDQMTYGSWDDGNISNNALAAPDPQSLGRLPDGTDSNNGGADFKILQPTPGQPNMVATATPSDTANKGTVSFNELYPNPPLGDELEEYIELINSSNTTIDLRDWTLADEDTKYVVNANDWLSTAIEPGKLWLLPRPKTKIALDNEGKEKLTLSSPDGKTKITLSYEGPALAGATYARNKQDDWQWSTTPTPGVTNIITTINQPPHIALYAPKSGTVGIPIMFDGSDSIDHEGGPLSFSWNFGDDDTSDVITPSHVFTKTGRHTVRLTIRDTSNNEASDSATINIVEPIAGRVAGEAISSTGLVVNEFMPNPKGSDDQEWVELYNTAATPVSTAGWKLIVNDRAIPLPLHALETNEYLTITKIEGKFSLLNRGGVIGLESPSGKQEPTIEYGTAPEGKSYALGDSGWAWTTVPTPGAENILLGSEGDSDYQTVPLAEIKTLDNGTPVNVSGLVAAPPGLLGARTAFLAGSGVQLNILGDTKVKLAPGDWVAVTGTISRTSSGTKLVVRARDTIQILEHKQPPQPLELPLAEISEDREGELVTITGKVSNSSASSFTLTDGSESLRVVLRNRELIWPKPTLGAEATVTGFVALTRSGPQLWARSPADVSFKPGSLVSENIDLTQPEPINWQGYVFLGLLALILGAAFLWERYKLPTPFNLIKKYLWK